MQSKSLFRSTMNMKMAEAFALEVWTHGITPQENPESSRELAGFLLDCVDAWKRWGDSDAALRSNLPVGLRMENTTKGPSRMTLLSDTDKARLKEALARGQRELHRAPAEVREAFYAAHVLHTDLEYRLMSSTTVVESMRAHGEGRETREALAVHDAGAPKEGTMAAHFKTLSALRAENKQLLVDKAQLQREVRSLHEEIIQKAARK
jgi:hypothetical protein